MQLIGCSFSDTDNTTNLYYTLLCAASYFSIKTMFSVLRCSRTWVGCGDARPCCAVERPCLAHTAPSWPSGCASAPLSAHGTGAQTAGMSPHPPWPPTVKVIYRNTPPHVFTTLRPMCGHNVYIHIHMQRHIEGLNVFFWASRKAKHSLVLNCLSNLTDS